MAKWNPQALKRLIETHSVVGYPVEVPIFGGGVIDKQIRPEKGGFIFYRVMADTPIPFKEFIEENDISDKPMTEEEWREKFVKGGGAFPAMQPDLMTRLEEGGKVSHSEVVFRELADRGCVDLDNKVFCHTFPSDDVALKGPPKKGMLVEVYDTNESKSGWPGRVVGYSKKDGIVLVEQFYPISFLATPEALIPEAVKPSYALPETWIIGKGPAHVMEDEEGVVLPAGKYSEDGEEYHLEAPIPLEELKAVCERFYPDQPLCYQQSMMLTTLPLLLSEVTLRPFPEGTQAEDVVVEEIAAIPEGEYEHIEWEKGVQEWPKRKKEKK